MANRNQIRTEITGDVTGLRKALNTATKQVTRFGSDLKNSLTTVGGQQLEGIRTGFLAIGAAATAAAVGGIYTLQRALGSSVAKASEFSTAVFSMQSSLDAANRQFKVGTASEWEKRIESLGQTLRVYSETDLRLATGRTIDMTKRLGLSADQMQKVIEVSGELGAGKTSIVDAVERVTAALRGEAEASEYLGLTLNEDYVKGWAKANNATSKAWKDLTDLEKAQIRYRILLEQATPSLGKAAKSTTIYSGALQSLGNDFGGLQKEVGGLVTNNSFVIESFNVLGEMIRGTTADVKDNRDSMVNLVKEGYLSLVTGIGMVNESMRFLYNAFQGLNIIAHATVTGLVKGFDLVYKFVSLPLSPLSKILDGMAKLGLIDVNPLKEFGETLSGFADYSAEELSGLVDGVAKTNAQFDEAKAFVEKYRQKIAEIPAEYRSTTDQMKSDTKKVEQEVKKVDGVWTNVTKSAEQKHESMVDAMIADLKRYNRQLEQSFSSSSGASPTKGFSPGGDPFFGPLPGYGGGDNQVIRVERGEHVIRKEAVRMLGHGFFQKYNNLSWLRRLPALATGGPVGDAGLGGDRSATYNLNMSFAGSVGQASRQNARELARLVLGELQQLHRGRA